MPGVDRPNPVAFKASNRQLSVIHVDRVEQDGGNLQDLCINAWSGAGEAHLRVVDCMEAANDCDSPVFDPRVYWRPELVHSDWAKWKDAHVQVESKEGKSDFPITYRVALVTRCKPVRRPSSMQSPRK